MKILNIIPMGKFINPSTNRPTYMYKGVQKTTNQNVYFTIRRGAQHVIEGFAQSPWTAFVPPVKKTKKRKYTKSEKLVCNFGDGKTVYHPRVGEIWESSGGDQYMILAGTIIGISGSGFTEPHCSAISKDTLMATGRRIHQRSKIVGL